MSRSKGGELTTGNVARGPEGGLFVIVDVGTRKDSETGEFYEYVHAIPLEHSNCSTTGLWEDEDRVETCHCGFDSPEEDCGRCKGKGRRTVHVKGWKHATKLANSVQDFILDGVKRAFKLE